MQRMHACVGDPCVPRRRSVYGGKSNRGGIALNHQVQPRKAYFNTLFICACTSEPFLENAVWDNLSFFNFKSEKAPSCSRNSKEWSVCTVSDTAHSVRSNVEQTTAGQSYGTPRSSGTPYRMMFIEGALPVTPACNTWNNQLVLGASSLQA